MKGVQYTQMFVLLIACGLANVTVPSLGGGSDLSGNDVNGVTVAVSTFKRIYEPSEPVPIIISIANHGSEPLYISGENPDVFEGSARVIDTDGVEILGEPVADPNVAAPGRYYMKKNGETIYVVPVSLIPGRSVQVSVLSDALKRHHGRLSEGTYRLVLGDIQLIRKIGNLIIREDLPHKLWADTTSPITRVTENLNSVRIEIRKATKVREAVLSRATAGRGFSWPPFVGGAVVGLVVPCAILLLRSKGRM
jgi:hypothetical protein